MPWKERVASSKFQLYKLTSFNWNRASRSSNFWIWKFQLYKLTSFNWNLITDISRLGGRGFNCTNLHPSTETTRHKRNNEFYVVSIVQTYILQLKHPDKTKIGRMIGKFQLYKLTSFNWNFMDNVYLETFFFVSIVQTYILQLKLLALSNSLRSVYVSIVQTYILQLKLGSFLSGGVGAVSYTHLTLPTNCT